MTMTRKTRRSTPALTRFVPGPIRLLPLIVGSYRLDNDGSQRRAISGHNVLEAMDLKVAASAIRRSRKSPSKKLQVKIFCRDGWLCRWCKKPVIFAPVMKLIRLEVQRSGHTGNVAYYHAHWTRQHSPLLDELGAVIDHEEAFSAGGPDSLENLVTACNKCNAHKSATLAATFGALPRKVVKGKYGEPRDWDGLSQLFVVLATRHAGELTRSEKDWLAAITLTD